MNATAIYEEIIKIKSKSKAIKVLQSYFQMAYNDGTLNRGKPESLEIKNEILDYRDS